MEANIIVEVDGLKREVKLVEEILPQGGKKWFGYSDDSEAEVYKVVLYQDVEDEVYLIETGSKIQTDKDYIKEQFINNLIEFKKSKIENEFSGIEATDDKSNYTDEVDPYDPELIRVDPRQFSVKYIHEMISSEEKEIDLSPDFQRNFVWNDITMKSRLIESLLLRIPLPVFYFTQDKEGKFQVVDGVQRLTVLESYINNEFKLKNLEYLKECEGKYFNKENVDKKYSIDQKYVRRINGTQLSCNIIDPQTPPKVKFDIFKRINTGGKTLNPQEIRNCLSSRKTRDLIKKLAMSEEFTKATDNSISSVRMANQDLVLRFIGFYCLKVLKNNNLSYKGDMDSFLDAVLMILNDENVEFLIKIESAFYNSMKNAYYLFGKYAFRKCLPEHLIPGARKQLLNKSLFVTVSTLLSKYDYLDIKSSNNKDVLVEPFVNEIESNAQYLDLLTNATSDSKRLDSSFEIARKIISKNLRVVNDKRNRNK